jgi:hypothetical protein
MGLMITSSSPSKLIWVDSFGLAYGGVFDNHYVIKFVSDWRQVCGFLWILPISSTNKNDRHDITEILHKVALNTINQTKPQLLIVYLIIMIKIQLPCDHDHDDPRNCN